MISSAPIRTATESTLVSPSPETEQGIGYAADPLPVRARGN